MSNHAIPSSKNGRLARKAEAMVAWFRARPRTSLIAAGCVVLGLLVVLLAGGRGEAAGQAALATVERGPLLIAVTESGTIRAKDNLEMKCEVEGRSTITFIVDEGTRVKEGDLLVELDSSELEEKVTQREMSHEDAKAAYANAVAQFDITKSRNESNTDSADQNFLFATMDLDKWLGENPEPSLTPDAPGGQGLPAGPDPGDAGGVTGPVSATEEPRFSAQAAAAPVDEGFEHAGESAATAADFPDLASDSQDSAVDEELHQALAKLAELARLDTAVGEEKLSEEQQQVIDQRFEEQQKLIEEIGDVLKERLETAVAEGESSKLEQQALSDISLALGSLSQALNKLRWTVRLHNEEHVSKDELTSDSLSAARAQANLVATILDYRLSKRYTWRKEVTRLTSAVREAEREVERVRSQAEASLAQAEAELNKRKTQLELQKLEWEQAKEQLTKVNIRAPKAGLVVYPRVQSWRGSEQLLEVGAEVRQRQVLITLPDLSELIVDTKIYESEVNRVRVGQRALVKVQALALALGETKAPVLEGEVSKIAILPDYGNRFLNPDQKTFNVEVSVGESREEVRSTLKPEMTAEVSIVLAEFPETLHVPVQAVTRVGDQTVCYVPRGAKSEPVPVRVGLTNTTRAQILAGLDEGDKVLLAPPIGQETTAQALGIPGVEVPAPEGAEPASPARPAEEQPAAPGQGAQAAEAPEEAATPTAEVNIDEVLSQVPAEARERIKQRLETATPEERQQILQRVQSGGPPGERPAGGRRGGRTGGEGQQPREQ